MDEDSSSNNGGVYVYNGVDEVPEDVTHVRVDPSVTIIPEYAFLDCDGLEEVELPEGLVVIREKAFHSCESLRRVNLPSTLKEIGDEAFDSCANMKEIVLPKGLQRLGQFAFYSCVSLTAVDIPFGIQTIERGTFINCSDLTEVLFPEGVQEIGQSAFRDCRSLASINLPSSLKVIGESAFYNCKGLNGMNFHDNVQTIDKAAFYECSFLNFRLPPLVTVVDVSVTGGNVKGGNKCLVSLELSENVTALVDNHHQKLTYLNSLRNIALPSEYSIKGADRDVWWRCKDLLMAFPNKPCEAISNALKHRFDDLPIHKICYYQTYHPTETVMQNLRREINPWTAKFPGQLNASGKEQDCLGMTPLHILACSTKQNVEMYRLLIEKYPETLIMKDKWGDIPLVYAVWCNAPADVIQLLVESYKSTYPEYVFDWAGMILTMTKRNVPLANIQTLVNMQQNSFPDQHYDMGSMIMELAAHDTSQSFNRPCSSMETFRYLLHFSISKRLDSLDVRKWRLELDKCVNEFPDEASLREGGARALFDKLALYESLKEAAPVLELALWKAKINEMVSTSNGETGLVRQCNKTARVDNEISYKDQCRISCGADIVLRNVLRYLLPK